MKKTLLTILAMVSLPSFALAANITVPQSSAYGQVLIGNAAGGNYTPVATSTLGISGGGASFAYPFTPSYNYSAAAQATTGIPWFQNGLQASSTSQIAYASTTYLSTRNGAVFNQNTYPQVFFGLPDPSANANVEINSYFEGPYTSYGLKNYNGVATSTAALVLDTTDTLGGIPNYLALVNQTGSATCLQIKDGGVTCLSDYNSLSSLLDTISPAYSAGGTESGMTTTLQQPNGNDAVDYGLQNYPGAFATGIDAYQNYYSSAYAQALPEPHFSFWEQQNGNTSEAATSWGFLGATTTVSGANATTTSVDIGDLGNTPMFRALLNPANATLNVISSSSKAVAFTVSKNTLGILTTDFQVTTAGTASATALTASGLGTPAGTFVAADPTGRLIATTTPSGGGGSGTVNPGTATYGAYYPASSAAVSATSMLQFDPVNGVALGNGTLGNASHVVDITATGTNAPLTVEGGEGAIEFWKDTTPSRAIAFGMATPGTSITDNFTVSGYNGSAWNPLMTILNNTGGTNGYVGIGTASPSRPLTVVGSSDLGDNATVGSLTATSLTATSTIAANLTLGSRSATVPNLTMGDGTNATTYAFSFAGGRSMLGYDITTGNTVINSGNAKGFSVNVNGNSNQFLSGTSALFIQGNSTNGTVGNVGLGTSSPYATLSVQSNSSVGDAFAVATSSGKGIGGWDNDGHRFTSGPAPAISSCGTGTGTVAGDDQSGVITTATAATACTVTFAKAYRAAPICNVTDNSLVGFADISSVSASAVTFGISSALTGGNLYYQCSYHK